MLKSMNSVLIYTVMYFFFSKYISKFCLFVLVIFSVIDVRSKSVAKG